MSEPIKVFFLEPTNLYVRQLRRARGGDRKCSIGKPYSYCCAATPLDTIRADTTPIGGEIDWPRDDPRWPAACAQCGSAFGSDGHWLVDHERVYRRHDTGDQFTLRNAPIGACWNAEWMNDLKGFQGPDGRTLVVRCPDRHDWVIDSRARNCTLPNDDVHKCWVRHGRPEDGTLHVDKNGVTCSAGAGSIDTGSWHGFLRHGHLCVS